jgi:hypothetical protein
MWEGCNWEWDSGSGVMAGMQKWAWCLGEGEGCEMGVIGNGTVGVVRAFASAHTAASILPCINTAASILSAGDVPAFSSANTAACILPVADIPDICSRPYYCKHLPCCRRPCRRRPCIFYRPNAAASILPVADVPAVASIHTAPNILTTEGVPALSGVILL